MKKAKNISIAFLSAMCLMLASACVFLTITKDNTPPEINFDDIILSYTEGDDMSVLFSGVSASDLVDGDVTDRMIIKSITVEKGGFATVIYAVTDSSNNVTERSRHVIYKKATEASTSTTTANKKTSAKSTTKTTAKKAKP